ncbi:MAG: sulfurtransferase TusA family protein [Gammaproteobacteria bacterium WSBS_2016_MAG_OTU1]
MRANLNIDLDIDLSGLRCPLPVLRVKKALGEMKSGDVLRVLATDPGATEDIPAFIKQTGHEFCGVDAAANGHYFIIAKK